jgi:hypothetical protein
MIIDTLVCRPDGTQEIRQREVPDDFFDDIAAQITALKSQLAETDYKIIKCLEYSLAGLETPYDIAALHAERQAIRDEINALEALNAT